MMNREQAVAYGKRVGVHFYVKNSLGGLLGGCATREAALEMKRRFEADYKKNPWNRGVKVFIETV